MRRRDTIPGGFPWAGAESIRRRLAAIGTLGLPAELLAASQLTRVTIDYGDGPTGGRTNRVQPLFVAAADLPAGSQLRFFLRSGTRAIRYPVLAGMGFHTSGTPLYKRDQDGDS